MKKFAKALIALSFVFAVMMAITSCGCKHASTEIKGQVSATCAREGYTGDTVCKDCGEVVKTGQKVAKLSHTYDEGVITKLPSCIETGVKTFTCQVCQGTKVEAVATVAHSDIYHDALDNTHTHTCANCTMSENLEHTPTDNGVYHGATCTEPAYTEYTCADCEGVYKVYEEGSAVLGHRFGEWETTVAPTCKAEGTKTHECERCQTKENITLPMNTSAHTFSESFASVTKEPTCTEKGTKTYTCTVCGVATKDEELPCTAHNYQDEESDGTGWVTQSCSAGDCDASRKYYDASTLKEAEITVDEIPDNENLELGMENATIAIPSEVVEQIKGTASENVTVKADFVTDTAKDDLLAKDNLTADQKKRLESVDVYDFGISGVGNFNASVTVTIPYTLHDGEDAEGITIWYVKNDGTVEEVDATYNATTETVTFSVSHFSFYAVAYQETQAMKCRRGVHDMKATTTTVTASCQQYGYTVYECSYCHIHDIGNLVERLDHAWGDVIQPEVTCEEGGYAYRECANCHEHLNSTYVRAKGHTVTGMATCTASASCTDCGAIVKPALGHKYSDWTVTVAPTAIAQGTKIRSCLNCGAIETVKIAPTGTVESLEYDSIEELYAVILKELTGLEKGTLKLNLELASGVETAVELVFDATDGLELSMSSVTSMDGEENSFAMYYSDNIAYVYDGEEVMITTLEEMMSAEGITFDAITQLMESLFDSLNVYAEQLFTITDKALAVLPADAKEKLGKYIDSLETCYTYYALRFGFDTNLEIKDGVTVPTAQDVSAVLEALMTKTESNGAVNYTFTAQNLIDSINSVIDFIEENAEKTVGDVMFDVLAEQINKVYPTVTDIESLMDMIAIEFPGTLTVKEAIVKISKIAVSADITLQSIYDLLDEVLSYVNGEDVDSKQMLEQSFNMTLNEFAAMMMSSMQGGGSQGGSGPQGGGSTSGGYQDGNVSGGEFDDIKQEAVKPLSSVTSDEQPEGFTVEALYAQVEAMLTQYIFGELAIPVPEMQMTVSGIADMLEGMLKTYGIELDVSVNTDQTGSIKDANVNFGVQTGEGESQAEVISGRIELSSDATITVPELIKPYADFNIVIDKDSSGNITVSGLNSKFNYGIHIEGEHEYNLKDLLERDDKKSAELGYVVYRLDKKYSSSGYGLGEYLFINGKYYKYGYNNKNVIGEVTERVNISSVIANPENYLPDSSDEPVGVIYDYETKEETNVYHTVVGFVYQEDGEWKIINTRQSSIDYNSIYADANSATNEYTVKLRFNKRGLVSAPYSQFMANVSVDSIHSDKDYPYALDYYFGHEFVSDLVFVELSNLVDYASWGQVTAFAELDGDKVMLVAASGAEYYSYRMTAEEVKELPEYDEMYEYTTQIYHNGALVKAKCVSLNVRNYEYYREIVDGVYVNIESTEGLGFADVSTLEKATLSDGTVFYIKGTDSKTNAKYGYVEIDNHYYCHAYVSNEGDVVYRNARSTIKLDINDVVDVSDYVVKNSASSYTVKSELIQMLDGLVSEDETYAIAVSGIYQDAEAMIYVHSSADESELDINDMFGSMGGMHEESSEGMWYNWFGYSASNSINIVPNADGTVSIFYSSGQQVKIDYGFDRLPVDSFVTYNPTSSAGEKVPLYNSTEKTDNGNTLVKVGNSYYSYNTYSVYNATYFTSAATITAADWYIDELTLMIPAINQDDDIETDVYYGRVYIEGLESSITAYFTIVDGTLKVLTGVEVIGDSAIKYEGMVDASVYFSSVKIVVNTNDVYSWGSAYIAGSRKSLYEVSAQVIEPKSLSGLDADKVVSYNRVRAIKTATGFRYIKSWIYEGNMLEIGSSVTVKAGWELYDEYENHYNNGYFNIASFRWVNESTREYIEIGGEYNRTYDGYKWNLLTEEQFKEAFYEKVYLYEVTLPDGTTNLMVGDSDGSSLEDYEGNLHIQNADKVNNMGNYYYDMPTVQYVFYMYEGTPDNPVYTTEIGGDDVYYNADGSGYIKVSDTYYTRGYLAELQNGGYRFECENFDVANVSSAEIRGSEALLETMSYVTDGAVLVLSPEYLEFFEQADFVELQFWSTGNGYNGSCSIDQIRAAFDIAEAMKNQTAEKK